MLEAILFQGKRVTYNSGCDVIVGTTMFDYIVNEDNSVQVANRIFNMRLYNLFLSQEELNNAIHDVAQGSRNDLSGAADWIWTEKTSLQKAEPLV